MPWKNDKRLEQRVARAAEAALAQRKFVAPVDVRLVERPSRPPEPVVIWPIKEWTCSVCADSSDGLLIMEGDSPPCMACAGMDQLAFLESGDAALTRRARAGSGLPAVVVRFSRSRRRYEC